MVDPNVQMFLDKSPNLFKGRKVEEQECAPEENSVDGKLCSGSP